MKKSVRNDNVFYTLQWSKFYPYDKHDAARILPELTGILCFTNNEKDSNPEYLIFYGSWRKGLRAAMKDFMDPDLSKYPEIVHKMQAYNVHYKYTVIDSSRLDIQDVMFWLIQNYEPVFNDKAGFFDSKRYKNIYLKEQLRDNNHVIERFHNFGL